MSRALVGGLAALACACASEPGPLDPEVVSALARWPGDAQGSQFSGAYVATLTIVECGCPTYPYGRLCPAMDATGSIGLSIRVNHGDGLIEIETDYGSLFGRVDADGGFAAGEVLEIGADVVDGRLVSRADGDFDVHGAAPTTLSGELARHLEGDLDAALQPDTSTFAESSAVDCLERFTFDAVRTGE